tara:strand:- start:37 stop:387 length:351 start_codon:yes stop_codon:yes gene_type:complete
MKRPLCKTCRNKPRAYAYKKGKIIYWRSQCDTCIRKKNKFKTGYAAKWYKVGYRKKKRCELCGFKQTSSAQMDVYHVDGNRNNVSLYNLKTICANCQRLKSTQDLGWQLGDLEVDG